jgi:hypothetical protein
MPANLRHGSGRCAVKAPANLFPQAGGLLRVRGTGQLFGQAAQLPTTHPLLGLQIMNKRKTWAKSFADSFGSSLRISVTLMDLL